MRSPPLDRMPLSAPLGCDLTLLLTTAYAKMAKSRFTFLDPVYIQKLYSFNYISIVKVIQPILPSVDAVITT